MRARRTLFGWSDRQDAGYGAKMFLLKNCTNHYTTDVMDNAVGGGK